MAKRKMLPEAALPQAEYTGLQEIFSIKYNNSGENESECVSLLDSRLRNICRCRKVSLKTHIDRYKTGEVLSCGVQCM